MNTIVLNSLEDFNTVINADLVFISEEKIDTNMWSITLDSSLAEHITVFEIRRFIDKFLEKKRNQVAEYNLPATCYIWVDEQAFQLCLNIILGHTAKLPFGCKINIVKTINPILEKFLANAKIGVIPWEEITFVGELDEDDCTDYVLDVYLDLM